jgi:hypothetical protein
MKTILLLLILTIYCANTYGQEKVPKRPSANASNIFFEVGGSSISFSLNYDGRFSKREGGFGGRAGVGFFPSVDFILFKTSSIVTIPIGVNYLAGKGPDYWEFGAGATIVSGGLESFFGMKTNSKKTTNVAFVPSIGYRHQPLHKGLTGRVVISPFVASQLKFFAGGSLGIRL